MGEDADDSGGLLNDYDGLQLRTTMRALLDVDIAISIDRFNNCAHRIRPFALLVGVWAQSLACAGAGAARLLLREVLKVSTLSALSSNEDKRWRALPVSLTTYDRLVIFALEGNGSSQKRDAPYVKH